MRLQQNISGSSCSLSTSSTGINHCPEVLNSSPNDSLHVTIESKTNSSFLTPTTNSKASMVSHVNQRSPQRVSNPEYLLNNKFLIGWFSESLVADLISPTNREEGCCQLPR
uniref:Uncharacterized protein n=1 Tax=Trichobilharzia regenti TaxID=157069 RepID=A0AA85IXX1_TRIRE|nr:unnamed protein product [Trichobilharzia regenti]